MNVENDKLQYQKNFENFRKIRDLKNGPHGIVSLYEDPSNSQKIAIKTLYCSEINDQEVEKSFQNEIKALIELKHKCILPIYGYSLPIPSTKNTLAVPPKIGTIYAENGSEIPPLRESLKRLNYLLANLNKLSDVLQQYLMVASTHLKWVRKLIRTSF